MEVGQVDFVQGRKKKKKKTNTLWSLSGICFWCMLIYLERTKYNEMNIHFSHAQKHVPNKI